MNGMLLMLIIFDSLTAIKPAKKPKNWKNTGRNHKIAIDFSKSHTLQSDDKESTLICGLEFLWLFSIKLKYFTRLGLTAQQSDQKASYFSTSYQCEFYKLNDSFTYTQVLSTSVFSYKRGFTVLKENHVWRNSLDMSYSCQSVLLLVALTFHQKWFVRSISSVTSFQK